MRILFVCANPSVGLIQSLDGFRIGATNRMREPPIEWPNGKAVTAAAVLRSFGGDPSVVLPAGGERGRLLVRQLRARGLRVTTVPIADRTRATYTLLTSTQKRRVATQILEPGPILTDHEQNILLEKVHRLAMGADVCVIAGSLPLGVSPTFYSILIDGIRKSSAAVVLLDTSGEPLRNGVKASPEIVKINLREFGALAPIPAVAADSKLLDLVKHVAHKFGVKTLIVTRRHRPVLAWSSELGPLRISVPRVPVVNPVGAGDCFTGGFVSRLESGVIEALRHGVAVGTANVMGTVPGSLRQATVEGLLNRVRVLRVRGL